MGASYTRYIVHTCMMIQQILVTILPSEKQVFTYQETNSKNRFHSNIRIIPFQDKGLHKYSLSIQRHQLLWSLLDNVTHQLHSELCHARARSIPLLHALCAEWVYRNGNNSINCTVVSGRCSIKRLPWLPNISSWILLQFSILSVVSTDNHRFRDK